MTLLTLPIYKKWFYAKNGSNFIILESNLFANARYLARYTWRHAHSRLSQMNPTQSDTGGGLWPMCELIIVQSAQINPKTKL